VHLSFVICNYKYEGLLSLFSKQMVFDAIDVQQKIFSFIKNQHAFENYRKIIKT
jgi:hypothetical protein